MVLSVETEHALDLDAGPLGLMLRGGDPLDLLAVFRAPAWQADALCREYGDVDYFPTRGQSTTAAVAVCSACLVRRECAAYALQQDDDLQGIWAGTSARSRRSARKAGLTVDEVLAAVDAVHARRAEERRLLELHGSP